MQGSQLQVARQQQQRVTVNKNSMNHSAVCCRSTVSQAKAASAGSRRPPAPLHVLAGPGCAAVVNVGIFHLQQTLRVCLQQNSDSDLGIQRTGRYNCCDSGLIVAGDGAAAAAAAAAAGGGGCGCAGLVCLHQYWALSS